MKNVQESLDLAQKKYTLLENKSSTDESVMASKIAELEHEAEKVPGLETELEAWKGAYKVQVWRNVKSTKLLEHRARQITLFQTSISDLYTASRTTIVELRTTASAREAELEKRVRKLCLSKGIWHFLATDYRMRMEFYGVSAQMYKLKGRDLREDGVKRMHVLGDEIEVLRGNSWQLELAFEELKEAKGGAVSDVAKLASDKESAERDVKRLESDLAKMQTKYGAKLD